MAVKETIIHWTLDADKACDYFIVGKKEIQHWDAAIHLSDKTGIFQDTASCFIVRASAFGKESQLSTIYDHQHYRKCVRSKGNHARGGGRKQTYLSGIVW